MLQVQAIEDVPSTTLDLEMGDVHVWYADLAQHQSSEQRLIETLSPEERHRMARLRFGRDRYRFAMRRGLLRWLIGSYLLVPPQHITFAYGVYGKPQIATSFVSGSLRFNTTHSNGFCLFAFSRDREVGVDVERIDCRFPYYEIAGCFFTPREIAEIIELPATLRHAAFFRLWTCKEACVKADGRGLSLPLEHVAITIHSGAMRVATVPADVHGAVRRWSLQELSLHPGFAACLAVEVPEVAVCGDADDRSALCVIE